MTGKPKHLSLRIDEDLLRKFEYVAKYDDNHGNEIGTNDENIDFV